MAVSKNFELARNVALAITVSAAIATGIVWIIGAVIGQPVWVEAFQVLFSGITVIGGTVMGILWFIKQFEK
jgi:hypothetical protein